MPSKLRGRHTCTWSRQQLPRFQPQLLWRAVVSFWFSAMYAQWCKHRGSCRRWREILPWRAYWQQTCRLHHDGQTICYRPAQWQKNNRYIGSEKHVSDEDMGLAPQSHCEGSQEAFATASTNQSRDDEISSFHIFVPNRNKICWFIQ